MAYRFTVADVKETQAKLEADIKEQEASVTEKAAKIGKLAAKGKLDEIKHLNRSLTLNYKSLDRLKGYRGLWKYNLRNALRVEAGYGPIVEWLEDVLGKDLVWYRDLKADLEAVGLDAYKKKVKDRHITKIEFAIACMGEEEALKTFQNDLEARFNTLVKKLENKVGQVQEVRIQRNENYGVDGMVIGEEGSVSLHTIMAGGHNIQRLHYRTLID